MNYVFCITVLFNILQNSSTEYKGSNEAIKHEKETSRQSPLIQIVNNTSKVSNLKSNIFDKMLSEELLSIKNHLYEKDTSLTPSVHIIVQGNVATPRLELKQKWPIEGKILNTRGNSGNKTNISSKESGITERNVTRCNETNSKGRPNKGHISKEACHGQPKDKILGLRSLPENPAVKLCTCMRTNPRTSCTHLCTGMGFNNKICTHVPTHGQHRCTKSTDPTYLTYSGFPLYVSYPSYFWKVSTIAINPYYQATNTKRRKNNKGHETVDTYDANEGADEVEFYDDDTNDIPNNMEVDDNDVYISKLTTPHSVIDYNGQELIESITLKKKKRKKLHKVNKDEFVNDVIDDLRNYYSDVLIKDCYCSLSSRNYVLNIILLQCLICAYLLLYY